MHCGIHVLQKSSMPFQIRTQGMYKSHFLTHFQKPISQKCSVINKKKKNEQLFLDPFLIVFNFKPSGNFCPKGTVLCGKTNAPCYLLFTLFVCVSLQKNSTEDSLKKAVAEGQQRARVVAQRGKSMEELGTSKITRLPAISKSSEQLDQLRSSNRPAGFSREKRKVSAFAEARQAQGQERDGRAEHVPRQAAEGPETVPITQGQTPHQTQRRFSLQHSPEAGEDPSVAARDSSRSTTPTSPSSCRLSLLPGPHGLASDAFTSSRPPSETDPASPRGLESSERGSGSISPSPTQTKAPSESRCMTR